MNWDAIGAVGEILGALAVFVSLIYLAIQTKQNTRALKSASFHQVRESFSELSLMLAQDPELNSLLLRATSGETDFTREELARYNFFVLTMLRRAESAYFHSVEGTLEKESWKGIGESCRMVLGNELSKTWWKNNTSRFNPSFVEVVSREILST